MRKKSFLIENKYDENAVLKSIVSAGWIQSCCGENGLEVISKTMVKCSICKRSQSFKKLTIFNGSHLNLNQIWLAIYCFTNSKGVTSAKAIQKIGKIISYRSSLNILDRIRLACSNQDLPPRSRLDQEFRGWLQNDPHRRLLNKEKYGQLLFAEFYTKKILFTRDGNIKVRIDRVIKLSVCTESFLNSLPRRR